MSARVILPGPLDQCWRHRAGRWQEDFGGTSLTEGAGSGDEDAPAPSWPDVTLPARTT